MAGQLVYFLLLVTLLGFLCTVNGSSEELLDFDFSDLKEIDWNYNDDSNPNSYNRDSTTSQENLITFDDDLDSEDDNQVHPFDWREKMLRTALSKALTNKAVRQKFIEVMPILRVLSKQQRLALSALITAQVSAKKGHELKLDQVRMMFGDDKSLLLPIVYDIANLVRNSAKKYIEFDYSIADLVDFPKNKVSYERRTLELTPAESAVEEANENVGTVRVAGKMSKEEDEDLEDFMGEAGEMPSTDVLDPMEINAELALMKTHNSSSTPVTVTSDDDGDEVEEENFENIKRNVRPPADPLRINHELQKDVPTMQLLKGKMLSENKPIVKIITASSKTSAALRRNRRSAANSEFVHKLIRSVPASISEPELQRGLGGRTLKLNTTAFATPKEAIIVTPSTPALNEEEKAKTPEDNNNAYQLVEDFAFASLNGSEVSLSDDDETANVPEPIAEGEEDADNKADNDDNENKEESLPTPEELIAGPRYRISGSKVIAKRVTAAGSSKRKRISSAPPPPKRMHGSGVPPPTKCERFTASMCIRTEDYPMDLIMGSIRRHRNAMTALLAEHIDPTNAIDHPDDFEEYVLSKKRRQDTNMVQGGLCQSIVRYARPQKARSASGEWKYIVNTGQHTQTLRLEKCTSPQESCSYLSSHYRSHCAQVYNYHRLLSWDKTRGLHVDIFKVPTCCSCQVDGYKQQQFAAALSSSYTKKDYSTPLRAEPYRHSTDPEYTDEDDEENDFGFSIRSHHHQQYKPDAGYDANELYLSSNRVKTKVPSPTVGSYLSPPGNDEFEQYPFKLPKDTSPIIKPSSSSSSSKTFLRDLARRRPNKSYNDYHSDLDYSPSEQHAERETVGTTALRPSPLAPEPFVPSQQELAATTSHRHHNHHHQQQQQQQQDEIPMPTKSHQKTQQRSPLMEQQYPNHQYPQQHHHPSEQHHYQPITTQMQQQQQEQGVSKSNSGYGHHTRTHLTLLKRPASQQRHYSKRPNTLRRHRSARLILL